MYFEIKFDSMKVERNFRREQFTLKSFEIKLFPAGTPAVIIPVEARAADPMTLSRDWLVTGRETPTSLCPP